MIKTELTILWRTINISTLLILKLFDWEIEMPSVSGNINKPNVRYPIHYLCYKYGMLKCYLDKSNQFLHILFDSEIASSNLRLTNGSYHTFIDRLIDSKVFHNIETRGNITKVCLKIPSQYYADINAIQVASWYSKVSDFFKSKMKFKYKDVPIIDLKIPRYIVTNNIPYRIVTKSEKLKAEIHKTLTVDDSDKSNTKLDKVLVDPDSEYYITFNPFKEYWTDEIYKLYE